jgi:hypothetical protein
MPTFALDDDWVEIDADDYNEEQDMLGTPLIGRVYVELPGGMVFYYGLFAEEG